MNTPASAPYREPFSPGLRLLLAGPIIWSVYHIIGYFLVEIACTRNLPSGPLLSVTAMTLIVAVLTLLSLGGIAITGFLSYRLMRQADEQQTGVQEREHFLGMVSALFNIVLALTVLADGASLLVLGPCGGAI